MADVHVSWRAVDGEREEIDIFVQKRCNKRAALMLLQGMFRGFRRKRVDRRRGHSYRK